MQVQLFGDLPVPLKLQLLTDWLDLRSVCQLETAYCTRSERTNILALLSSEHVSFVLDLGPEDDINDCVEWLLLRNAKVNTFISYDLYEYELPDNAAILCSRSSRCLTEIHCGDHRITLSVIKVQEPYPCLRFFKGVTPDDGDLFFSELLEKVSATIQDLDVRAYATHVYSRSYFTDIYCPHLRKLMLENVGGKSNLQGFAQCCPNLEELTVGIDFREPIALCNMLRGFPKIIKLVMSRVWDLTDQSVLTIAQLCPQLTHLDISRNKLLTPVSIKYVCENCTQLRTLNLNGNIDAVNEAATMKISMNLSASLTSLSIRNCVGATCSSLKMLAQCVHLQTLDISGIYGMFHTNFLPYIFANCVQLRTVLVENMVVSDHALCLLAEHCPNISTVSVARSTGFTEDGVLALAELGKPMDFAVHATDALFGPLALAVMKRTYPRFRINKVKIKSATEERAEYNDD